MIKDPALLTDSTGEGMAGATDVPLELQQKIKVTQYNGTRECKMCGTLINPLRALSSEYCVNCSRRNANKLLKNRMAQ